MNNNTRRQLLNAIAAEQTPAVWIVRSSYVSASELKASEPMSYRMAKVTARIVREACGWATIERIAA